MTTTAHTPRRVHTDGDTGRCQHCQQVRPVFPWSPAPLPWEELDGGWLCARCYSDAVQTDDRGETFHIDQWVIVWPENEPRAQVHDGTAPASSGSRSGAREDGAK